MIKGIPLHNFIIDDEFSIPFKLEVLNHKNDYDTSEPHRHNYYEIFFFVEGGGVHLLDYNELEILPNSIHFVSPGQVHQVKRDLKSSGFVLLFSREFFHLKEQNKELIFEFPFFGNKTANPTLTPDKKHFEELLQLVLNIKKEYRSEQDFTADIISSYLNILLLKCKQLFEKAQSLQQGDTTSSTLINRFQILLEKNFNKLHMVSDYAGLLSVTPNRLNDITRKSLGRTASDLIQERILLEAKRLLLHSDISTKEIAAFLSYEDASYFSRFFKKHTGLTPSDFKLRLLKTSS